MFYLFCILSAYKTQIMKNILVTAALALSTLCSQAQNADARVGELINRADWFALDEELPALKDSMQVDFLRLLAETMVANNFNQPEKVLGTIETLLTNHQAEMAFDNVKGLVMLAATVDGTNGNYKRAADDVKSFHDQVCGMGMADAVADCMILYNHYNALRDVPAPELQRPAADVVVPVSIEKVKLPTSIEKKGWRGTHIMMPVTVHGKSYPFIFDTGATTSVLSERMAKELGVRVVKDSVLYNQNLERPGYGKLAVLDSLQVEDIVFRNLLVTILPPTVVDSVLQVDAILGYDFMKQIGEFHILPNEGKVVFPAQSTALPASGRNLMHAGGLPYLKATSDKGRLSFVFDTGCTTAALYYPYYAKYKDQMDKTGVKEDIYSGGFNLVKKEEKLRVPSVAFQVGDMPVEMKAIIVSSAPDTVNHAFQNHDGIMGMDLINQYKKVIVNFKDMFVEFEN